MCAIFGFVGLADKNLLFKMARLLAHRGPDDSGFHQDQNVSLGHRRLSIIDLSPGGHQPFLSEDKKKILVANGEIYNFKALRKILEKKGHKFFGKSDNEVILHGYEEWGRKAVTKLVGIFAFALWDKNKKTLILIRDHLGVKPLYYAQRGDSFIFASEAKAILAWEKLNKEVDPVSIDYYLSLRFLPGERTMFKEIKRLSPGSVLIFKNGKIKIRRYWQPGGEKNLVNEEEAKRKLRAQLEESVFSQLVSDVPLGTYLSGGIDSSVITALAQKKKATPLETFSLGFGSKIDEIDKAREVAKFLKTDHHQFLVSEKDFTFLPEIVGCLDEPIGDPIILPIYLLAKNASKEVKVVLTGDGADEIFGGYIHHLGIFWKEKLTKIFPPPLLVLVAKILPSKIIDQIFPYPASIGEKGKERLLQFLRASCLAEDYLAFATLFNKEEKKKLYSSSFAKKIRGKKSISQEIKEHFKGNGGDSLIRVISQDIKFWLPDYVLEMADRLSMAHGLEIRVPYLDFRLVEFALSLRSSLKIRYFQNKFILRKAMGELLPEEVLTKPKQAFFVPLERFFGQEMEKLILRILSQKAIEKRGLFNFEYIKELKNEFKKSPLLVGKQLMALIILELWLQKYADFKL